jgi:hypothetical protein
MSPRSAKNVTLTISRRARLGMNEQQKPVLRLCDPRNLESVVAFIEEMSGEKMTPEEIQEVRRLIGLASSHDPAGSARRSL